MVAKPADGGNRPVRIDLKDKKHVKKISETNKFEQNVFMFNL